MGQSFFLSLYDENQNKYLTLHPFLDKLGEVAYNEHRLWSYIKNNPLRLGWIGDQSERFAQGEYSDEDGYDYGVASVETLYQSDCAGLLEFISELPEVSWTGYIVNHTRKMYVDVAKYYETSKISKDCIDPLVVLTASNGAATLFWNGFSENTAYSLLGYWFTDVIEWTDNRPENMDELCSLEFCEFFWKTLLDLWGVTDDGYLANRDGDTFYLRKDVSLWGTKISPAKVKYKISKTDTHVYCETEFVPDDGVTIIYGENDSVTFVDASGNKFADHKQEWFGSAYLKEPSGKVQNITL